MGAVKIPRKVLLFSSIFYSDNYAQTLDALKQHFGALLFESPEMQFGFTNYYEQEMGASLLRRFVAFEKLISRDALPDIKLITNAIEDGFLVGEKRTVNLDPGILSMENVCLATTKPYSHRIYLTQGIWAEVTLMYQGDSYHALPWTYPDYGSVELIGLFNMLRNLFRGRLKCQAA